MFYPGSPETWPKFLRRAFVLLLPVTLPLWLGLWCSFLIIAVFAAAFERLRQAILDVANWLQLIWEGEE